MPRAADTTTIRIEIIMAFHRIRDDYRCFCRDLDEAQVAKTKAARAAAQGKNPDIDNNRHDRELQSARAAVLRAQDNLITAKALSALLREVSPDAPDVFADLPADIAAHLSEMQRFFEEPPQAAQTECQAAAPRFALLDFPAERN